MKFFFSFENLIFKFDYIKLLHAKRSNIHTKWICSNWLVKLQYKSKFCISIKINSLFTNIHCTSNDVELHSIELQSVEKYFESSTHERRTNIFRGIIISTRPSSLRSRARPLVRHWWPYLQEVNAWWRFVFSRARTLSPLI